MGLCEDRARFRQSVETNTACCVDGIDKESSKWARQIDVETTDEHVVAPNERPQPEKIAAEKTKGRETKSPGPSFNMVRLQDQQSISNLLIRNENGIDG
ncbi:MULTISPECIES: hypothetical protein [Burkholderia]|uniref:hypothetical protein n=1 Tax=Burkholderia TaxID=32008 RepID=UPI000F68B933|nr:MULTISPECIES: hypothetical protein [Burkholderia]MBG0878664.1 hypothetical protein [Burkholderia sp. 9775_39]MBG0884231.1 hypothetical protein [Burkholderia sp. 9773_38]